MAEGNGKGDSFADRFLDLGEAVVGGMESLFGAKKATDRPAEITTAPARVLDRGERELLREVRLSPIEIHMLRGLAERAGRMTWDWSKARPDVKELLVTMINKGLVKEVEYVTHAAQVKGTLYIELTDQGRQCLSGLAKAAPRSLPAG